MRVIDVVSVVLAVILVFFTHIYGHEVYCVPHKSREVHVSVATQRNVSGHWISQVSMHHERELKGTTEANRSNSWLVDVNQTTGRCNGQTSTLDVTLTITSSPPKPPADYKLFPGVGYYKLHKDATTWARAHEICAEEDGHLVIINSDKERDVMKEVFIGHTNTPSTVLNTYAWIGLFRQANSDKWSTLFGDSVNVKDTTFGRWAPGNPKQGRNDRGLVSRTDGSVHDYPGSEANIFICEYQM